MNKFRLVSIFVILAMLFSFANVSSASASSVTIFSADFDSGVPSEFSGVTTTEGVQGYTGLGTGSNVFGGNFLRNDTVPAATTTLTLTNLPPHDSISLSFLLAIIDSWDGASGTCQDGDEFNVSVDGTTIFGEAFENSNCGVQTYNPPAGVELARRADLGFSQGFYWNDSAYDMGLDPTFQNIPHTASTLTIEWFSSGGGWQGGTDESWALDNVQVFVHRTNSAPIAVAGGPYLVAVGQDVTFDGSGSSDPDGDALSESWTAGGGTIVGNVYTAGSEAGIFDVCLTVNDGSVDSESDCTMLVVYDPSGGFVTGGGWIDSPAGAYKDDESLSGKATFGFVAKYKKGANVPDGNTQFQFKAGDLNFHSTSYEWLVVAGNKAQFKGEGTINGQGSYKFMIWVDDDNPDTFRIQISGDNGVVYDNGSQQSLGGGSIKVHK